MEVIISEKILVVSGNSNYTSVIVQMNFKQLNASFIYGRIMYSICLKDRSSKCVLESFTLTTDSALPKMRCTSQ